MAQVDLGLLDWTDQQIFERVSDITAALINCGQDACSAKTGRGWRGTHGPPRRSSGCSGISQRWR
jgi:hypothetical protein